MATHYEESLQRDIDRIRHKVTEMAGLAQSALEACLRALVERNRQMAYAVILRDQRIDALEKEIDRLCLEFIVRQQPVAKHLRFAYVTIKINQEIERVGDYAESIARQIIKLAKIDCTIPLDRYRQIADMSIPMFRDAVQAYLSENADTARRLSSVEEEVDGLKSVINAELFQLRQENKIPLEALTPLMTIARRFERVSDQAKNICEETLYMVTGDYQKHAGGDVWRVLFIDEHNSCRSQMAEAIASALDQPQFLFASAGLEPRAVDPQLVAFMKEKGIDLSHATSRSIAAVPNIEHYQIVIALAKEARRSLPTKSRTVCLDWSIPDPSLKQGTAEERRAAYEETYRHLREQIEDLVEGILADKID
ncbi:MAG TPA: phosphate signaling complex protein PhoU [Methylomirabilota bacterium]|nr:phosphate signaling complex protein PhoU [Methylomirabilota bacterium]